jgi:hypothetical protein
VLCGSLGQRVTDVYYVKITLLFFLGISGVNLEISKLVGVFRRCNDTQEISKLLLLQIFLRQVLQISLGEWWLGSHDDLIFFTRNSNFGSKVTSFSGDFDRFMKKGFERRSIKDTIFDWCREIDGELE